MTAEPDTEQICGEIDDLREELIALTERVDAAQDREAALSKRVRTIERRMAIAGALLVVAGIWHSLS